MTNTRNTPATAQRIQRSEAEIEAIREVNRALAEYVQKIKTPPQETTWTKFLRLIGITRVVK